MIYALHAVEPVGKGHILVKQHSESVVCHNVMYMVDDAGVIFMSNL